MTQVPIVTAGFPWALNYLLWSVSNDGGRIIISVDLLAP